MRIPTLRLAALALAAAFVGAQGRMARTLDIYLIDVEGGNATLVVSPWRLHFSLLSGQEHTVPGLFIANEVDQQPAGMPIAPAGPAAPGAGGTPPPAHNGSAHWLKVTARDDGAFTVTNGRNAFSKTYPALPR